MTVSAAGGCSGLSVTNISGAPGGRCCSRLTQYDTHTAVSSLAGSLVPRKFQEDHTLRFRGIRDGSVGCRTDWHLRASLG